MPKGTRVHRCVEKLTDRYGYSRAIAICQKSTRQNYMTGKHTTRKKRRRKRRRTIMFREKRRRSQRKYRRGKKRSRRRHRRKR